MLGVMFEKDISINQPQTETVGVIRFVALMKWLGGAVLVTIVAASAYGIYAYYIAENLYEVIAEGSYKGIEVGEERSVVWKKLPNFSSSYSINGYREIEFLEPINQSVGKAPAYGYVRHQFPIVAPTHYSDHQSWVIYFCPSKCDWRRDHEWVSFNFEGNVLSSIIRYKKRVPELI